MPRPTGLIFFFVCLLVLFTSFSEAANCFNHRGKLFADQVQCPGTDACCGVNDACQPNRLCKSKDNADNILVRGTCLHNPWDNSTCAEICVFDETRINTGLTDGVFPRVEICDASMGKYCCREGSSGTCCSNTLRTYYLDNNGNLLSVAPTATALSSATTTTSVSGSSPATTNSGGSASSTSTADGSSSSDGESLALKVGLGVGIPLAAVIAALATWYFLHQKKHNKGRTSEPSANTASSYYGGHAKDTTYQYGQDTNFQNPSLDRRYEMHEMPADWNQPPRELAGSEVRQQR
ncbi:hypothetical protein BDP81DRAFT_339725 [Colletotrichum phormii]|uniref:Mid2 domain-containing protein n=1 Tax=Colletotrichum phormii TaxID=359342 RepID=A0AAJ0EKH9_9PEZI|nr:uncharacterized protein BDP81DRAFT_339725 [Colletotrichum phormii]KAK1654602.1 hypothetical protein BDP81DRAFT_339725 [Colletotrichum phormii]